MPPSHDIPERKTPPGALALWSGRTPVLFDESATAEAPAPAESAAVEAPTQEPATEPESSTPEPEPAPDAATTATEAQADATDGEIDYGHLLAYLDRVAADQSGAPAPSATPPAPSAPSVPEPKTAAPAPAPDAPPAGAPSIPAGSPLSEIVAQAKATLERAKEHFDPDVVDATHAPLVAAIETLAGRLAEQDQRWQQVEQQRQRALQAQQAAYAERLHDWFDQRFKGGVELLGDSSDAKRPLDQAAVALRNKVFKRAQVLHRAWADSDKPLSEEQALEQALALTLRHEYGRAGEVQGVRAHVRQRSRQITIPPGGPGTGGRAAADAAADPYAEAKAAARKFREEHAAAR